LFSQLWSAVFVFASYLAPLTLKLILEFIAYRKLSISDPEEFPPQPNHLAVMYIALMFVSTSLPSSTSTSWPEFNLFLSI